MPRTQDRARRGTSLVVHPDGASPYSVHFVVGGFRRLGALVGVVAPGGRAVLLADSKVDRLYGAAVAGELARAGRSVLRLRVPAGEPSKSVGQVERLWDALVRARVDRTVPLVALGGGVVGDLGGFVAATYLRGIPLIQVPTTLLAQVDSSVGGKTGVDHRLGKNLIGAFHHPRAVFANMSALQSLPEREYRAGLAEVVKSAVLGDAELFRRLETDADLVGRRATATLQWVVRRAVSVKAAVVGRDPYERGERATLNLGHTLAHVLEQIDRYRGLRHGEAVAIGLAASARLAAGRGWLAASSKDRICALLERLGLPIRRTDLSARQIAGALGRDKKVIGESLRFVAPIGIGATRLEWIPIETLAGELAAAAC